MSAAVGPHEPTAADSPDLAAVYTLIMRRVLLQGVGTALWAGTATVQPVAVGV